MKNPDKIKELLRTIATVYPSDCLPWVFQKTTAQAAKDALTYIRELENRIDDVNASPFDVGMSQAEYLNGEAGKETPPPDFAPVKHGVWIPVDEDAPCDEWQCTACWETKTFVYEMDRDEMKELYSYCPNCGAKMHVEDGE